jgi:hypothetical protein
MQAPTGGRKQRVDTYTDNTGWKKEGTQFGQKGNICAIFTHRCCNMKLRSAFVLLDDVVEL